MGTGKILSVRNSVVDPYTVQILLKALLTSAPSSIDMSVLLMPDLVDAEGVLISSNFRVNLGYTHLDVLGTAV